MHARRHTDSNDTFKHSLEVTFQDNDFEIVFHIAVGKFTQGYCCTPQVVHTT